MYSMPTRRPTTRGGEDELTDECERTTSEDEAISLEGDSESNGPDSGAPEPSFE